MRVSYNPKKNSFFPSNRNSILPQVMWHITDRCKLNCKMCFAKNRTAFPHNIDENTVEDSLSLLSQLEVQKIDISGGEPLLCPSFTFIVNHAVAHNFHLTVTTRGLGYSNNIDWLLKNWKLFSRIIVSIDCFDRISNDSYVDCQGAFDSLLNFVTELAILQSDNLRINTVVNRTILENKKLIKMCELIQSIMPKEWCIIQPHPLNKRDTFDDYSVNSIEYNKFVINVTSEMRDIKNLTILTRPNTTYSTYWCLYPDNTIARLSQNSEYSFQCLLCKSNLELIKQEVNSSTHVLP